MKNSLDKAWLGLVIGIILPIVFGFFFLKTNGLVGGSVVDAVNFIVDNNLTVKFLCVVLFPDMAAVFLLNTMEMWQACRGMFASIFIYMAVSLCFLFF